MIHFLSPKQLALKVIGEVNRPFWLDLYYVAEVGLYQRFSFANRICSNWHGYSLSREYFSDKTRAPRFYKLESLYLRLILSDIYKYLYTSTFYPLRRESRWSKDHDKLPRSTVPPMNGSEEAAGGTKGSKHQ